MARATGTRLLRLAYSTRIAPATLAAMERLGRRLGLPLETLERLGQDPDVCEAFLRAGAAASPGRLQAFPLPLAGPSSRN